MSGLRTSDRGQIMLDVQDLYGGYPTGKVLYGAGFTLQRGELVVLMGQSGMGKSTLLKAVIGLARTTSGTIRINGHEITHLPAYRRSRLGLSYVPAEGQLFAGLTVDEHLQAAARPGSITPLQIYRVFPFLRGKRDRQPHELSAAERKMLAIGRALATNPQVVLIDRGTEGLSPVARREILSTTGKLRDMGLGVLLVDLYLEELRYTADRFLVMEAGRIVFESDRAQILLAPDSLKKFLAI